MGLNNEQRAQVVAYQEAGWKYEKIGLTFGVHPATIGRIIRKFKQTSSYAKIKQTGRPKKMSKMDGRQLVSLAHGDRRGNLEDFRKEMRVEVSVSTLRRELLYIAKGSSVG
jgi:transposase